MFDLQRFSCHDFETISDFGPVDGDAFAFHAAEPCHLSLCELVDGGGKLRAHLFQCEFSDQIECNEFVLEAIVYKVLG